MRSETSPSIQSHDQTVATDLRRPRAWAIVAVLILFVALLAAMFYIGYVPREREAAQAVADAAERAGVTPTVSVLKPTLQAVSNEILLPCDVRPFQQTAIYPRASGYLKKQYVDLNDQVKEGQLLADIDIPEVDAQLVQSKAALEQAKANYAKMQSDLDLAQKTLARYQHLAAGVISDTEMDTHKSAVDDAKAALAQAKAAIAVAEADVQRLTVTQGFSKIVAPFAGKITTRNYDVGALLSATSSTPGKELFNLVQSDQVLVDINIPQVYASQIKPETVAELEVRNFPGQRFGGKVDRISGAINSGTRTMLVQLLFPNSDGRLFAGMYGQVHLRLSQDKPLLTIPTSAMIFNTGGTQVAIVKDGKVHFQPVQLGRDLGTEMEILSGLEPAALVVANPSTMISEGLAVASIAPKTVESSSATRPIALR